MTTTRSGGYPKPRRTTRPPSDNPLREVLYDFMQFCKGADTSIVPVDKLERAFRAVVHEQVRQLPGRAQKGAIDAALTSVLPKIRKALKP